MLNERYIEMRKEKKRFLESELREYERVTAMTEEEASIFAPFQYLGGQNAYAYWTSQLEKGVNDEAFSPYDEYFTNYLLASVVNYATGLQTLDEAIATFQFDCQSYAPEIQLQ